MTHCWFLPLYNIHEIYMPKCGHYALIWLCFPNMNMQIRCNLHKLLKYTVMLLLPVIMVLHPLFVFFISLIIITKPPCIFHWFVSGSPGGVKKHPFYIISSWFRDSTVFLESLFKVITSAVEFSLVWFYSFVLIPPILYQKYSQLSKDVGHFL